MKLDSRRSIEYAEGSPSQSVLARPKKALPKIVSLFAGAGGLDLGFKQSGFSISVAIDASDAAIRTHKRNFPRTKSVVADLVKIGPSGVIAHVKERVPVGQAIGVIGGPPCQGFSRANSMALSTDPRNKLPQLYLKIIAELRKHYTVEFIVFENVLGIRDKKHIATYMALVKGIEAMGFDVTENELCAVDFGVPQTRRRIVLAGLKKGGGHAPIIPRKRRGIRTVREAIGNLQAPAYFSRSLRVEEIPVHPNHWTMQPKSPRFGTFEPQTAEQRSFKRLEWDQPSRTIAFGHREIHIHPDAQRRLSIFEAMLIQGFPTDFVLEGNLSEQVEQVSNAVPPPLARSVANAVRAAMQRQSV